MPRERMSVSRAVWSFALSGAIVLILVGVAGVWVLQRVGKAEALRRATDITTVEGRGLVEPNLTNGIVDGDAASISSLDALVQKSVIGDPVVRVKIWDASGRIVYSDVPDLIGQVIPLAPDKLQAMRSDTVTTEVSTPTGSENQEERRFGRLMEVYFPVHAPDGTPLLFEAYLRFDSVVESGQRLWESFVPVLAVALIVLASLQIPLAHRLALRVRNSQQDREALLQKAIDSSDLERRRIAADLHDGPVQQMAGIAMSLSATADRLEDTDPAASEELRDAAIGTREGMRSLRSSLMGIYPPSIQQAGLAAALSDLTAPLSGDGVDVRLNIAPDNRMPAETQALLFRVAQEAVRNIAEHAEADRVDIIVEPGPDRVTLQIRDDGRGFSLKEREEARSEGHLGLQLVGDLVRQAKGTINIASEASSGTLITVEVPFLW